MPAAAAPRDRAARSPSSAPGPAGMAAAQQLRRAGHAVTLFERDEAIGGLVRFGVPDFKIEKTRRRAARRAARRRGRRAALRRRRRRRRQRRGAARSASTRSCSPPARACRATCRCPGRELDGVHFAMDYLYQRNRWVARELGPEPTGRAARRRARDHARRQGRRRDRRRRHRRRLRRQRAARGRALDRAARAAARAARRSAPTTARRGRSGR